MHFTDDPAELELPANIMKEMGNAVLERVVGHISSLETQPSGGNLTNARAVCRAMTEDIPEQGGELEPLLDSLFDEWIPRSYTTVSPGYMAYIPAGGIYPAALADLVSNIVNRYTGVWDAAPALVQLEANALNWIRDWMQFPETTRGLFTTGGSMAIFNAVAAAREKLLGTDIRFGTVYVSSQTHHSIEKAARLAGIAHDRVRTIPVDSDYRMKTDVLANAIASDRASGLTPFFVVSNAGSTNTGAVDPINEIADIAADQGLWHHVDGAYGGFFHMVPELRPLLAGLPRGDSLTLDPHKGLFLPYGTGCLLVRDGEALRALHSSTAGYLPDNQLEFYDPAQYGPDLSRGFPGLRVWLTLKIFGAARYRAAIREKRELALWAASEVAAIPGVVMDAMPQLSLFAFHLEGQGLETRELQNTATRELMTRVTKRGRVMLTGSQDGDRYIGRVCILSFRTRRAHALMAVQDIREESDAILREAAGATR